MSAASPCWAPHPVWPSPTGGDGAPLPVPRRARLRGPPLGARAQSDPVSTQSRVKNARPPPKTRTTPAGPRLVHVGHHTRRGVAPGGRPRAGGSRSPKRSSGGTGFLLREMHVLPSRLSTGPESFFLQRVLKIASSGSCFLYSVG